MPTSPMRLCSCSLISLPALALQRQFYLARGANVVLFRFTIVPARGNRLPLVTTRNSAPSLWGQLSEKLSDLRPAANVQRLRNTRQPRAAYGIASSDSGN